MKKPLKQFGFVLLICFSAALCRAATDTAVLTNEVAGAVASFERTDSGFKKLLNDAPGYVVFPNIGKGGFFFGGAYGEGLVYERRKLVGRATLTQVTFGAQAGGQMYSEVILFQDKYVLDQFKQGNWEMSGQVSAVVAAEGESKNARYVDGVLVLTKPKTGLMLEASVGGQKFTYEPIQPTKK